MLVIPAAVPPAWNEKVPAVPESVVKVAAFAAAYVETPSECVRLAAVNVMSVVAVVESTPLGASITVAVID